MLCLYQHQQLVLLEEFYDRQGNQLKATWAQQEITAMKTQPRRAFLVAAEIAGPNLRATTAIVEADLLYDEAMELSSRGRGKIGKFLMDTKKLYLAVEKFNELITNYPQSDKIDDSAFQAGQIYDQCLGDYTTALLYYQRVWQWDVQTPWPVRFAVARIYDDQLKDRVKALQYYEMAISLESAYPENIEYSQGRIDDISKTLAQRESQ